MFILILGNLTLFVTQHDSFKFIIVIVIGKANNVIKTDQDEQYSDVYLTLVRTQEALINCESSILKICWYPFHQSTTVSTCSRSTIDPHSTNHAAFDGDRKRTLFNWCFILVWLDTKILNKRWYFKTKKRFLPQTRRPNKLSIITHIGVLKIYRAIPFKILENLP